ncbi:MAG: hypothetical protein RMM51_00630 [Verrucomicrobiae bacterium]|nr:hypothetical protein [Verrucomicrobiae bacterium]
MSWEKMVERPVLADYKSDGFAPPGQSACGGLPNVAAFSPRRQMLGERSGG